MATYKFLVVIFLLKLSCFLIDCASDETNEFCEGNGDFFSGHRSNSDANYISLRKKFTGCKYVYGDLTISSMYSPKGNYDFSFLETIEEVSGTVTILNMTVERINLKNLRVIRGEGAPLPNDAIKNRTVSLRIWANWLKSKDGFVIDSTGVIDLSGLRSVMNGDISLDNNIRNCFVHFDVDLYELLDDLEKQKVWLSTGLESLIPSRSQLHCEENGGCHESCTSWSSRQPTGSLPRRAYCWGPGPDLCQISNKCQPIQQGGAPTCQGINSRCFNQTQCCHSECVGGCTGSGSDQCFGCRSFKDGSRCVSACPRKTHYDKVAKKNQPNPDFKLTYGPFCIKTCPAGYFEEEESCVKFCSKEYKKDDATRKCNSCKVVDCGQTCRPLFTHKNILTRVDLPNLKNCKRIITPSGQRFVINQYTFNTPAYSITQQEFFDIFKDVIEIDGSLQIMMPNSFMSLPFLTSLVTLRGDLLILSAPKAATQFRYIGFQNLKHIGSIILDVNNACENWFPTKLGLAEMTLNEVSPNLKFSKNKRFGNSSQCLDATCHSTCDERFGCWGPSASMCVKCKKYRAGSLCVNDCEDNNYFLNSTDAIGTCTPCHSECIKSCHGPADSQCVACRNFKIGQSCVAQCPPTHYADPETNECLECSSVCDKNVRNHISLGGVNDCSGPNRFIGSTGCTSCKLVVFQSENNTNVIGCMEHQCEEGFYEELLSESEKAVLTNRSRSISLPILTGIRKCQPCHPNCISCKYHATYCDKCRYAYRKDQPAVCLEKCPKGTYQNENSTMCNRCTDGCSRCVGPDQNECLECDELRIYNDLLNISSGFTCVQECPADKQFTNYNPELKRFCADKQNIFESSSSSSHNENVKKSSIALGVAISVVIVILVVVAISCSWKQHQNQAKRNNFTDYAAYEEFLPMNPTSTPPNMSKLLIIKESELRRFDRPIGSGAFGTVYQGLWIPSDANARISVAIKVLSESSLNDELLDEAKVMASIQHPCCVRLLCVCMTSQLQLISQLMPLGSLLDYMRRHKRKIGSKHLLLWSSQIASGMKHLEQSGIIHRDLAARNVLVQSPNQVKITDFGLAKVLDICESDFLATSGKLPVKWLALESLQHKIFNFKTDVWAFGVTLWEIFTFGQRPYENIRVRDLCDFLEKGERLPQPGICTLDVYMLMIKCWMLDAESRPTFHDLETELQKMASDPGRFLYIPGDQFARLPSFDNTDPVQILPSDIIDHPDYGCGLPLVSAEEYLTPSPNNTDTDVFEGSYSDKSLCEKKTDDFDNSLEKAAWKNEELEDVGGACGFNFLDESERHNFLQRRLQEKLRGTCHTDKGRYTSDPCSSEPSHAVVAETSCTPLLNFSAGSNSLNLEEEEDYLSPQSAQLAGRNLFDAVTFPKSGKIPASLFRDYAPMQDAENTEYFSTSNTNIAPVPFLSSIGDYMNVDHAGVPRTSIV